MKTIYCASVVIAMVFLIQFANAQLLTSPQPEAPVVTAAQIRSFQSNPNYKDRFIIVDVRAKAETDVSVIPGAITQAEFEKTAKKHQGKAVLVYCTVGYRSGIYAKKLKKNGWNAWNYKGSILDWCNHQLPVVTKNGQRTTRVHTYNSSYSLARGYQAVF